MTKILLFVNNGTTANPSDRFVGCLEDLSDDCQAYIKTNQCTGLHYGGFCNKMEKKLFHEFGTLTFDNDKPTWEKVKSNNSNAVDYIIDVTIDG